MRQEFKTAQVQITDRLVVGGNNPFVLIAGPCVIESERLVMETAEQLNKPWLF